jgi:hypothetical protein
MVFWSDGSDRAKFDALIKASDLKTYRITGLQSNPYHKSKLRNLCSAVHMMMLNPFRIEAIYFANLLYQPHQQATKTS